MISLEAEQGILKTGGVGFCLSYVCDVPPEEVLKRYGADPTAAQQTDHIGADHLAPQGSKGTPLRFGQLGTWSFCYESPGVNGAMPWTLAALSQNTEVLGYHYGARGLTVVERWLDGQPVEQFEPGNERTLRARGAPLLWQALRHLQSQAGTDTPPEANEAMALRTVHDRVGAAVTDELLSQPLLSVWYHQPPRTDHPRDVEYPPLVIPPASRGLGRYLGSLPASDV
ncbi:DUF6461 domain-containing protein [Streptomyces griseoaurantiacus]|uniref:DUF6461 domain-containing protein n=1 Tax=Streptomyces griseoaurantiacus TaxID=68213 RepID=UPI003461211C